MTNLELHLRALLAAIRAERDFFQTIHWCAQGSNYYGDHLLYQRIYEGRGDEIDKIGELARLIGSDDTVDLMYTKNAEMHVLDKVSASGAGSPVTQAIALTEHTLNLISQTNAQAAGHPYNMGINNLLSTIAENHVAFLYLLRQRAGGLR